MSFMSVDGTRSATKHAGVPAVDTATFSYTAGVTGATTIVSSPVPTGYDGSPGDGKAFATITFAGAASNGDTITIIDTAGTSKTYTVASDGSPSDGEFPGEPGGGMNGLANGLTLCIEHANGHNGTITVATGGTGAIILTQSVAGSAGNTTITKSGLGVATVVQWSGGSDTAGLKIKLLSYTISLGAAGTAELASSSTLIGEGTSLTGRISSIGQAAPFTQTGSPIAGIGTCEVGQNLVVSGATAIGAGHVTYSLVP